jgi:hypothetical protein
MISTVSDSEGGGPGDTSMRGVGRAAAVGALVGAVIGSLVGLLLHTIVGGDDPLTYEIVAGSLGLIAGVALGAFYGGALKLPRDR